MTTLKELITTYLSLIDPVTQASMTDSQLEAAGIQISSLYKQILSTTSDLKNQTEATVQDVQVGIDHEKYISPKVLADILSNLPVGSAGDMLKSVYDTNNDGIVDAAQSASNIDSGYF